MGDNPFLQRLGAKKACACCAVAHKRRFVAYTSNLDPISLVPKTGHTGALSDFAFGSPFTISRWREGACGIEKAMRESEDKFRDGEGA